MIPTAVSSPKFKAENSSKPLVSVIIPFLNAEKFFEETIESVFAQTYDNWELILVDDGSTDRSTEIALSYAERYPDRVRYFEHDQHRTLGGSAARNLGIHNARGVYIAFLDADDIYLPEKIGKQVEIMEANPKAAMLYGSTQYWFSWTGDPEDVKRDWTWSNFGVEPDSLYEPPVLLKTFLQIYAGIPHISSFLMRREEIERLGGFEDSFHNQYDDQVFLAKVCLKGRVFVSSKGWGRYRQHPDSSCYVAKREGLEDSTRLVYLTWLEKYFSEEGVRDVELLRALKKALWPYRHRTLNRIKKTAKNSFQKAKSGVKLVASYTLPVTARRFILSGWRGAQSSPPVGWVDFGHLRRVTPFSRQRGLERGQPIDRYYIEQLLTANRADLRGRVLEIAENTYTYRLGGHHVTRSDVLYPVEGNPQATLVADLTSANHISSDTFDAIICTQTLIDIYDVRAAIATLHRILKPGGVLLVTVPGIGHRIARLNFNGSGDYWRFTSQSARKLFEEVFPSENVKVEAKGNLLTASAFLFGLAVEDLAQAELDYFDRNFEVLVGIRAVKPKETE